MSLVTSKDEKEEKGRKITTIIMIIIDNIYGQRVCKYVGT